MTTYFEVCSKICKTSLHFFTFVQYYCKQPFFYPAQALGKMYQPVPVPVLKNIFQMLNFTFSYNFQTERKNPQSTKSWTEVKKTRVRPWTVR